MSILSFVWAIFALVSAAFTARAQPPALNVLDFQCFLTKYAQGDPYANCDGSTVAPTLNPLDFSCFIRRFAAGEAWADCDAPPPPAPGWTVIPDPGIVLRFYVSSSAGSDSNPGTEAAPYRTAMRGYNAIPDGSPAWLLFKSGDTWLEPLPFWEKSSGRTDTYMLVSSYGTGPRPKFRAPQGVSPINLGTQDRAGLAFVGLDLEPATRGGSNYAGVQCLGHWKHLLFEDLWIVGFPGNIVIQDIEQTHITMDDIRIRLCIIADSYDTGAGHSQGIFFRDCSNWVMEGNVLDNNARNKADIFCHNVYINEGCGAGIFRDNISARACSHGVQQRPGGTMENNLFLANPINAYQGKTPCARCAVGPKRPRSITSSQRPMAERMTRSICSRSARAATRRRQRAGQPGRVRRQGGRGTCQ